MPGALRLPIGAGERIQPLPQGGDLPVQRVRFRFLCLQQALRALRGERGTLPFPLLLRQLRIARQLAADQLQPRPDRVQPHFGCAVFLGLRQRLRRPGLTRVQRFPQTPDGQSVFLQRAFGPPLLVEGRHDLVKGPLHPRERRFPLRHRPVLRCQISELLPLQLQCMQQIVDGLRRALLRGQSFQLPVELRARCAQRFPLGFLPLRQRRQVLHQRRMLRQISLPALGRGAEDAQHLGAHLLGLHGAVASQRVARAQQQVLIVQHQRVVEELAEDLILFIAVGAQKFAEFPLRQHHDLAKLLGVEPQQFLTAGRDLACALGRRAVGLLERGGDDPVAVDSVRAAFFAEMDRARDLVFLPVLLEAERHLGIGRLRHVVAVQHVDPAVPAAGLAEERKADRVKNRGFSGAGVARHEHKAVFDLAEGDIRRLGVGAEGGHRHIQRSHASSSFASCRSSRSTASTLGGR